MVREENFTSLGNHTEPFTSNINSWFTSSTQLPFPHAPSPQSSMFPHTFSVQHFHLEIGNATATVINVLIHTTFVRIATVAINDERNFRLFTRTPIHDGEYVHCITHSGTNQHHSIRGSIQRKLVKAMKLQSPIWHATLNFT